MKRRIRSRLMLLIRVLGVLGLFAALMGGLLLKATPGFVMETYGSSVLSDPELLRADLLEPSSDLLRQVALWCVVVGGVLAVIGLLCQLAAGLTVLAGRRNVAGSNAVLQTALVLVLLVGVNWWSFDHYRRIDTTGKTFAWHQWRPGLKPSERFSSQFTLPMQIASDLRQLSGETTVIVYQRHKTFGQLSDKPDAFDYAAERKVVEKVQDLVREFREFGSQFRVVVLDVEEEGFNKKLKDETEHNPELRKAIDAAPDNSIFFHCRRKEKHPDGSTADHEWVQRLSFNDFYQLDKSASLAANLGRGNLVLLPQGVEPFARRVLAIEEKRPKIGIAIIHEALSTRGESEISFVGLGKTLAPQGFDVQDIILKKNWGQAAEPEPGAQTFGEAQIEQLEEELAEFDYVIQTNRSEMAAIKAIVDKLKSNLTIDQLNRELRDVLRGQRMTPEARKMNIARLEPGVEALTEIIAQQEKERAQVVKQLEEIPEQERIREERRQTDVQAKLKKLLADCDLLILPRLTLIDVVRGYFISHNRYYRLDDSQVEVFRDFLKAGKPILVMLGPRNEPAERRPMAPGASDNVETLLSEFGIALPVQTVLFNAEAKAFAERRATLLGGGTDVKVPPVLFNPPKIARRSAQVTTESTVEPKRPNPISESMRVVANSTGAAEKLEQLRVRHPRPIYFVPIRGDSSNVEAAFLFSDPDSWNESDPFPTREKTPRYEPTKPDDPRKGTVDEEKRGPFPLGVALKTTVPADWFKPELAAVRGASMALDAADPTLLSYALAAESLIPPDAYAPAVSPGFQSVPVRLAAIGHGGLFSGPDLGPAKEKLLLSICNWLLGREDRLPHADLATWQFPRVELSERATKLWQFGTLLVMPGFFALLGCVVLIVRRYR